MSVATATIASPTRPSFSSTTTSTSYRDSPAFGQSLPEGDSAPFPWLFFAQSLGGKEPSLETSTANASKKGDPTPLPLGREAEESCCPTAPTHARWKLPLEWLELTPPPSPDRDCVAASCTSETVSPGPYHRSMLSKVLRLTPSPPPSCDGQSSSETLTGSLPLQEEQEGAEKATLIGDRPLELRSPPPQHDPTDVYASFGLVPPMPRVRRSLQEDDGPIPGMVDHGIYELVSERGDFDLTPSGGTILDRSDPYAFSHIDAWDVDRVVPHQPGSELRELFAPVGRHKKTVSLQDTMFSVELPGDAAAEEGELPTMLYFRSRGCSGLDEVAQSLADPQMGGVWTGRGVALTAVKPLFRAGERGGKRFEVWRGEFDEVELDRGWPAPGDEDAWSDADFDDAGSEVNADIEEMRLKGSIWDDAAWSPISAGDSSGAEESSGEDSGLLLVPVFSPPLLSDAESISTVEEGDDDSISSGTISVSDSDSDATETDFGSEEAEDGGGPQVVSVTLRHRTDEGGLAPVFQREGTLDGSQFYGLRPPSDGQAIEMHELYAFDRGKDAECRWYPSSGTMRVLRYDRVGGGPVSIKGKEVAPAMREDGGPLKETERWNGGEVGTSSSSLARGSAVGSGGGESSRAGEQPYELASRLRLRS